MESFIVQPTDIDEAHRELVLRDEEAHHAIKSLRLRVGEELLATNLVGTTYRCRVQSESEKTLLVCSIEDVLHGWGEAKRNVDLLQGALSQPARWEFLLEKATELGVRVITPVSTERTERDAVKLERSDRILRAAVKQCKRSNLPWLKVKASETGTGASGERVKTELYSLFEALSDAVLANRTVVLLHEAARPEDSLHRFIRSLQPEQPLAVAIGPEGGFSDDEVTRARDEFGACVVSLGDRRLRAETAAIAALALVIDH
jgi:16S rRNA (uracil1498-N3)-methyltransferase